MRHKPKIVLGTVGLAAVFLTAGNIPHYLSANAPAVPHIRPVCDLKREAGVVLYFTRQTVLIGCVLIDAGFVIYDIPASKGTLISKNHMSAYKMDDKTLLGVGVVRLCKPFAVFNAIHHICDSRDILPCGYSSMAVAVTLSVPLFLHVCNGSRDRLRAAPHFDGAHEDVF